MPNGGCTKGVELQQRVISLEADDAENKEVHSEMWSAIDKLRNRPPLWATAIISLLTFLCGVLGTWAKMKG